MAKRLLDIIASLLGILILSPILLLIALGVTFTSRGGPLFIHRRVGENGRDLNVYKFRTMSLIAENHSEITLGNDDKRITSFGRYLRKYKLDELPQLFNVLIGNMSLVGPRPEVRKYVDGYSDNQLRVLSVKPGITDYASIEFADEGEILGRVNDPEKEYTEVILPKKLELGLKYVEKQGLLTDLSIIFRTLWRIIT